MAILIYTLILYMCGDYIQNMNMFWRWRNRDAYLLVLRLKHDLQAWGSSTQWGLVNVRPSAIKKSAHHESCNGSPAKTFRIFVFYKIVPALNRMFRRLQTDSVTELRQISKFARLAFNITFCGLAKAAERMLKFRTKLNGSFCQTACYVLGGLSALNLI